MCSAQWINMVVFDTNNRDIMGIHGDIRIFVGHLEFHTTNSDDISRRICMDVYNFLPSKSKCWDGKQPWQKPRTMIYIHGAFFVSTVCIFMWPWRVIWDTANLSTWYRTELDPFWTWGHIQGNFIFGAKQMQNLTLKIVFHCPCSLAFSLCFFRVPILKDLSGW